jgi:transcriptional activator protein UGA3
MAETKPRQRKFAPRSRTGCLTCRTRRKRCDNAQPRCANCKRLNLLCEWQSPRSIVTEPSSSQSSSKSPELQVTVPLRNSLDPWDALPGDGEAERMHLLQYYIEAFVPSVQVAPIATSFYTSLYMPWSFQIEGMLDAILAISSAQLARRSQDADRAKHLRAVSSRHERKCYQFIKERLHPSGGLPEDTYQVTAVILILVGLEALNGVKTTRWISQLKSVQRILSALTPEQSIMDCVEVDSLHRHFTYHFASASLMARVSNAGKPCSAEQGLIPISAALMPGTIDHLSDTVRNFLKSSVPTRYRSFFQRYRAGHPKLDLRQSICTWCRYPHSSRSHRLGRGLPSGGTHSALSYLTKPLYKYCRLCRTCDGVHCSHTTRKRCGVEPALSHISSRR